MNEMLLPTVNELPTWRLPNSRKQETSNDDAFEVDDTCSPSRDGSCFHQLILGVGKYHSSSISFYHQQWINCWNRVFVGLIGLILLGHPLLLDQETVGCKVSKSCFRQRIL